MAKSFIKVRYDRMHNDRFRNLCNNLICAISKIDLKPLQLEDVFLNFERKVRPLLFNLDVKLRKMPQTESIAELRKRLEDVVSALLLYIKSLKRVQFSEQQEHINLCYPLIHEYLNNFVHKSLLEKNSKLNWLFVISENDSNYQVAYDALGITRFLQEITVLQNQIKKMENERSTLKHKQPKPGITPIVKNQIIRELKLLLMTIELSANTNNNEMAYLNLTTLISSYLIEERAQLRNLSSRRRTNRIKQSKALPSE